VGEPNSTRQCIEAARPVWKFLGVEEGVAWHERPGNHEHNAAVWRAFLEFTDRQWRE
jgi:hypothetical protein